MEGPDDAATALRHALPAVRTVRLAHAPQQSSTDRPLWELEDSVGMLTSSVRRLAPRWHEC